MTALPETTSVHEATIQKVARGELEPTPTTPKKRRKRTPRAVKLDKHVIVQPDVWETVKALCKDPKRVQVLGPTDVVIWNSPGPWPKVKR